MLKLGRAGGYGRLMPKLRLRSDRPGQALAIVGLALAGLVGVTALAVDIGMLFSARAEAQRTADASALAGASAFITIDPVTSPAQADSAARFRAYDYALRQTIMGDAVLVGDVDTVEVILAEQKVRVRITRTTIRMFFARIFGHTLGTVTAAAAAEAVQAGSTTMCLKPFAIPDMWQYPPDPAQDIYQWDDTDTDIPIWDFDAFLNPNAPELADSPHCTGTGDKRECEPEIFTFDGTSDYGTGDYGYGTDVRDDAENYQGYRYTEDTGRRIPLKINFPTDGPVQSFWFPWRIPGNSGVADFREALRTCVPGDYAIQDSVEADGVETENGLFPKPTYDAIIDLIDNGDGSGKLPDPTAYWDESANGGKGGVAGGSRGYDYLGDPSQSPRVITVAAFDPTLLRTGHQYYKWVDFLTFFLEDPRVVYPGVKPAFHAPITGRLLKYTPGNGEPTANTLVKQLRLIE